MSTRHLWVVEIWDDILGWRPATDAATTREMARGRLRWWKDKYCERTDKFRLVKYVPAKTKKEKHQDRKSVV